MLLFIDSSEVDFFNILKPSVWLPNWRMTGIPSECDMFEASHFTSFFDSVEFPCIWKVDACTGII